MQDNRFDIKLVWKWMLFGSLSQSDDGKINLIRLDVFVWNETVRFIAYPLKNCWNTSSYLTAEKVRFRRFIGSHVTRNVFTSIHFWRLPVCLVFHFQFEAPEYSVCRYQILWYLKICFRRFGQLISKSVLNNWGYS